MAKKADMKMDMKKMAMMDSEGLADKMPDEKEMPKKKGSHHKLAHP